MHEDIEFTDTPVWEGTTYNNLGKVCAYVLHFERYTLEITRASDGSVVLNRLLMIPLPVVEAMMRLDLAALVPMATEAKEEE